MSHEQRRKQSRQAPDAEKKAYDSLITSLDRDAKTFT
jgi:hypothetical protein